MAYANKTWEEQFCIRQSGSIKCGMVDIAEGAVGGNEWAGNERG